MGKARGFGKPSAAPGSAEDSAGERGCREPVTQGWLPPVTLCWCHWAACRPEWPKVPCSILMQFPHCWSERFRSALAGERPRATCPLPWLLAVLAAGAAPRILLLIAWGSFGLTLHHCCAAVAQPPSQSPLETLCRGAATGQETISPHVGIISS